MSRSDLPLGGMCRDGHVELHYSLALMGNDERCPACKLRDDMLAEVRRVVELVDTEVMHSCNVPFCEECNHTSGHHRAIDEILSRLDKL